MIGGAQGGALTQPGSGVGGWPLQITCPPIFSVVLEANKMLDQSLLLFSLRRRPKRSEGGVIPNAAEPYQQER